MATDVQEHAPRRDGLLTWSRVKVLAPLGVLIALFALVSAISPGFASPGSLSVLGDQASVIAILALGQTLVILTGGIDLSVAAVVSFASVLLAYWLPTMGFAAVIAVLAISAIIGAIHGLIYVTTQVPSFIITLGGLGVWSGVALSITDGRVIQVDKGMGAIEWFSARTGDLPHSFLAAVVLVAITAAALRWLPFGRQLRTVGLQEPAAHMAGLRVTRIKVIAFAFSGLCAGIGAVLLVAVQFSGSPVLGDYLLLPTLAAVLVGGTAITGGHGGAVRTLIGALVVTVLSVGMSVAGVPSAYTNLAYGVVLIAAVIFTTRRVDFGAVVK
jgi:ribose transport system permease protein